MSSPTHKADVPTGAITYIGQMPNMVVRVGSDAKRFIDLHLMPVAFVVRDRLKIYHGVGVYLCMDGVYIGAYANNLLMDPNRVQDQELYDLLVRVVTALDLRSSGIDGIMLRSEPPTTVLAALAGLPASTISRDDVEEFWRPEVVIPMFVRTHLLYSYLLMSIGSIPNLVDKDEREDDIRSRIDGLGDDLGMYIRSTDEEVSIRVAWRRRELRSLTRVRYVVAYP